MINNGYFKFKENCMRILLLTVCLAFVTSAALAETMSLKAKAKWVSDAPGEKIIGSAQGKAELSMTGADWKTLKGQIQFPVESMKSGNSTRDSHLRSETWLDAKQYPNIIFSFGADKAGVDQVSQDDSGWTMMQVKGVMNIHGVDQEMTAKARVKTIEKDGVKKVKIKTKFPIKLGQYQIKGKAGLIGDKVGETIEVSATLVGKIES